MEPLAKSSMPLLGAEPEKVGGTEKKPGEEYMCFLPEDGGSQGHPAKPAQTAGDMKFLKE